MTKESKCLNCIKVVHAERNHTHKWLAEQIGRDPATVSKWVTNAAQPTIETLVEISHVLQVDVKDFLYSTLEEGSLCSSSKTSINKNNRNAYK